MPHYSINEICRLRDYEKKTNNEISQNKDFTAKTEYQILKAPSNNVKKQSDKILTRDLVSLKSYIQ